MVRVLSILAAGVLVLVPGLLQGVWSGRWSDSPDLEEAVARMQGVPGVIGDWQGQTVELDRRAVKQAELAGYITRRYENRRTGNAVIIILTCGRPGPLSVHAPDVCYPGAGFELAAAPSRYSVDSEASPAEFWTARFLREELSSGGHRRVFWAWNAKGPWQAPDNPRLKFARFPALYKLYVISEMNKRDEPLEEGACVQFLPELLPELQRVLFPDS
jgi:hypothetical protein